MIQCTHPDGRENQMLNIELLINDLKVGNGRCKQRSMKRLENLNRAAIPHLIGTFTSAQAFDVAWALDGFDYEEEELIKVVNDPKVRPFLPKSMGHLPKRLGHCMGVSEEKVSPSGFFSTNVVNRVNCQECWCFSARKLGAT